MRGVFLKRNKAGYQFVLSENPVQEDSIEYSVVGDYSYDDLAHRLYQSMYKKLDTQIQEWQGQRLMLEAAYREYLDA